MRNTLSNTGVRAGVINPVFNPLGFIVTALMLGFAADAEGGGTAKNSVTRVMKSPILDVSKMTEEELRTYVATLQAKVASRDSTHSFRFNDGTEPNLYDENDAEVKDGKAKVGGVKSARDSGTISIYGFGRQPISLFPNQLIGLFGVLAEGVLPYISENADAVDTYLKTRKGFRPANLVNRAELAVMLDSWRPAEATTEPTDEGEGTDAKAAATA